MSGRSSENQRRGPRSKRGGEQYAFTDPDAVATLMQFAIGAALSGGAVRIGLTRDGGALAIGVYMGEDYGTEYIRPSEKLDQVVRELVVAWGIPLAYWDDVAERYFIS